MKQQTVRAIARNLVIATTLGLAMVASWAVTGLRNPPIDLQTANVCSMGDVASVILRDCGMVR
jgi:aminoglycoside N3'-acetyltransferase